MKKYAKEIISRSDRALFIENLSILNNLYKEKKITELLFNPVINKSKKLEFILSFCKNNSNEFTNFLKLLMLNKRIVCIPDIYTEVLKLKALEENKFLAKIMLKNDIDEYKKKQIQERLSQYFKVDIILETVITNSDEISIYIEDLGYEIRFSNNILKDKLKEYILKAI